MAAAAATTAAATTAAATTEVAAATSPSASAQEFTRAGSRNAARLWHTPLLAEVLGDALRGHGLSRLRARLGDLRRSNAVPAGTLRPVQRRVCDLKECHALGRMLRHGSNTD